MKFVLGSCLLAMCMIGTIQIVAQEGDAGFKKNVFYSVMSGKDIEAVNKQLELLKANSFSGKNAYEGALLMKKAGIIGGAKKKLDLFKEGHKKLEAVLQQDTSNAEYRFLRLMIQEHAPGILGYKGELEKDRLYIKDNFKKMQPVVQDAVRAYSKESKILKTADL